MAVTYTVEELRTGREMGYTASGDSVSLDWSTSYSVEVTDPGNGSFNAATDVDPYDVLTASGIPVVNYSIYSFGGKIIPFLICKSKKAKQDPNRAARWTVTCKYKATVKTSSEESDNQPISPPVALTDITPKVVPEYGETEKVLYVDKDSEPILTPTGNYWAEPSVERVPTLTLKITQYESSITDAQVLDRKLKVNSGTYRTFPRYDWIIEDIEPVEVSVTLSGGATDAALVTYTVAYNPSEYGWKDDRALIDTHYIDGGDTKPFLDGELRSQTYGFVTAAGAKHPGSEPLHVQFETQDDIDFDTFLQA